MIVLPGLNCPGLALDEPDLTFRQVEYMVAIQSGIRKYRALARHFGVRPFSSVNVVTVLKRKGRVEGSRSPGTLRIVRPLQWKEIA